MRLREIPWFLLAGCIGTSACGASPETRRDEMTTTDLDVAAWSAAGATAPPQATPEAAGAPEGLPIELAGGARFRSVVALSQTTLPPQPDTPAGTASVRRCSLYGIRATRTGLEEGNLSVDCPGGGLAEVGLERIPFHAVEVVRSAHLRAALTGASLTPTGGAGAQGRDRVEVLITTEGETVQDVVSAPPWPPPGAEASEQPRGSPPSHVGEVWEAIMFPGRYAAAPPRPAAAGADSAAAR